MSWRSTDAYDAYGDWDEEAVRVRPNPKANRPRTKDRPSHDDAEDGRVLTVDRGRFTVLVDEDGADERVVTASRARELGKQAIVTGDIVRLVGDTSGAEGSLARVVGLRDRSTLLRRSADDSDQFERVIVANADRLFIVAATMNPEPRPRLIDRTIVAALDAGIEPALILTKTDLKPADELRALVDPLGIRVFESTLERPPRDILVPELLGHVSVLVGHSGVGKSTLVNALVPDAGRETGHVNEVTGRGRHTSSSSFALRVREGDASGWIIDTPGVRSFGLGHVDPASIVAGFPDLVGTVAECPRGCTHRADAPDCELDAALREGILGAARRARVESLRRLLDSARGSERG